MMSVDKVSPTQNRLDGSESAFYNKLPATLGQPTHTSCGFLVRAVRLSVRLLHTKGAARGLRHTAHSILVFQTAPLICQPNYPAMGVSSRSNPDRLLTRVCEVRRDSRRQSRSSRMTSALLSYCATPSHPRTKRASASPLSQTG